MGDRIALGDLEATAALGIAMIETAAGLIAAGNRGLGFHAARDAFSPFRFVAGYFGGLLDSLRGTRSAGSRGCALS